MDWLYRDLDLVEEVFAHEGELMCISVKLLPAKSNLREDYLSQLRSPMPSVKNAPSGGRTTARV